MDFRIIKYFLENSYSRSYFCMKRKRGIPDVILTKIAMIVPRKSQSVATCLENNLWLYLAHDSEQKQSFCIRGDPSFPGLLKQNWYDTVVTHMHYEQITRSTIESTCTHVHRTSTNISANGVFLSHCLCFKYTHIPPHCNSTSNHTLPFEK